MALTVQQSAELRQLFISLGRAPSPAEVREMARRPGSSLSERFTWDEAEAALERQIEQARDILAEYTFVVMSDESSSDPIIARFFVASPTIAKFNRRLGHDSSYTDHETASRDHLLFDSVLSQAIAATKGNITRFGAFPQIVQPFQECLTQLEALRRPGASPGARPGVRPSPPALSS